MPMAPSTRGLLANAHRSHPDRLPYMRRYQANSVWCGFLSNIAISELELFGNTVRRLGGGRYLLNASGGHIQTTLMGAMQAAEEVSA